MMVSYSEQEMKRRKRIVAIATGIVFLIFFILGIVLLSLDNPRFLGKPIVAPAIFVMQLFITIPFQMWRAHYLNDKKELKTFKIIFIVTFIIFLFMVWKTWVG